MDVARKALILAGCSAIRASSADVRSSRSCPSRRAPCRSPISSSGSTSWTRAGSGGWTRRARGDACCATWRGHAGAFASGSRAVPTVEPARLAQGHGQPVRVHHGALQGEPARRSRGPGAGAEVTAAGVLTTSCGWRARERSPAAVTALRAGRHRQRRPRARRPRARRRRARATRCGRVERRDAASRSCDPGHPELPRDPARHTSALAAPAVLDARAGGHRRAAGIALSVRKGLPLSGGQGGSAASAVAGAVAANALLGAPLDRVAAARGLPRRGGDGGGPAPRQHRAVAARRHRAGPLDRPARRRPACRCRPSCASCSCIPTQRLRTAEARAVLPRVVTRGRRAAPGGAGRRRSSRRSPLATTRCSAARSTTASPSPRARRCCPGFAEAKEAALTAGALGALDLGRRTHGVRARRGREAGERVAAAMRAAYAACRRRSRRLGWRAVDRPGARLMSRQEDRPMKFQTPSGRDSWQVCVACGNEMTETRSAPALCRRAAACSRSSTGRRGSPAPSCSRASPSGAAPRPGRAARRASGASASSCCPSADERDRRTPRATRPPRTARRCDRWTGVDAPAAQARGTQPDRLVQGPRHDRRRDAGAAHRRARGRLRVHRQHLGVARRVRGAGGDPRPRARARRAASRWASWRRRSPTARKTLLVRGDFDDCLQLVEEASAAARRLPAQLDQPVPRRGAEDDRARAAPAARLGAARLDRAARRQPRQHRRVREGAARGARAGD